MTNEELAELIEEKFERMTETIEALETTVSNLEEKIEDMTIDLINEVTALKEEIERKQQLELFYSY